MLNKNDPLIGAVQEVMKRNQAEREAVRLVNEKFGVHDRKALPHEKQSAWDAAYKQVLSEGISVEKVPMPKTQPGTSVQGGQGIQGYDKQSKSAGSVRPQGDNPKVNMESAEGSIPTTPREKKLAAMHGNPNRITHGDKLKAVGAIEEDSGYVSSPETMARKAAAKQKVRMGGNPTGQPMSSSSMEEQSAPKTDPYAEQQAGSVSTVKKPMPKPTSVTPADQSALKNKIQSIMKEGAKVDRMVGHITKSEMKAGKSAEEAEDIAWATANKRGMLKPRKKTVKEGFNNRHNLSVNASVQEQVVAEQEASQGQYTGSNYTTASQAYAQKKEDARKKGAIVGSSNVGKPAAAQPYGMTIPAKLDPNSRIAQGSPPRPNSMQAAERQRRAAETQASLAAQREKKPSAAPAAGGSVTSGAGSVVPRPAAAGGSVTSGAGSVVPRPAVSPAEREPPTSVAVRKTPTPNAAAANASKMLAAKGQQARMGGNPTAAPAARPPAPAVRSNDTGRAGVPGTGNRLAKSAAAPAPAATPAVKKTAPVAARQKTITPVKKQTAPTRTRLTRYQRDAAVVGPGGRLG